MATGFFDDLVPTPAAPPTPAGAFDDLIPASLGQGLLGAATRGVKTAQEVFPVAQLIGTQDRGPSMRQERAAFEQALSDPRYMASLTESFDQPLRAAKVEETFGPERRLGDIREKQEAVKQIWSGVVSDIEKEKAATPKTAAQMALGQAQTPGQKWSTWLKNPVELTATIVAESLPASIAGAALGTMTGGPGIGTAAGVGLSSFATTLSSELLNEANRLGYDISDQQSLAKFVSGKDFDNAFNTAITKSAPVASIDTATAGAAGRFIEPALRQGLGAVARATGKEVLQQAIGGGGGEYLGQTLAGQPRDWFDIAMESVAEVFTGPQEAVSNIRATRRIGTRRYDTQTQRQVVPPVQEEAAPTTGVLQQPQAGTQEAPAGGVLQTPLTPEYPLRPGTTTTWEDQKGIPVRQVPNPEQPGTWKWERVQPLTKEEENAITQGTVTEGNIGEYPNRNAPRKTTTPSYSYSDERGRIIPATTEETVILARNNFGSVADKLPLVGADASMLSLIQDSKILRSIIPSIPIDVMNVLGGQQGSANSFSQDVSVFKNALAANSDPSIANSILNSLRQGIAELRAKLLTSFATGRNEEVLPALRTSDLDTSEIMRLLAPNSFEPIDITRQTEFSSAGARAKLGSIGSISSDGKFSSTDLTALSNWHTQLKAAQTGGGNRKVAPVQFLQVQEGIPNLVWYKLTGDITSPDGRVYPAGRNISNGELARFGYTVPESELAKSAPAVPTDIQVIGQVTPEQQPLLDEVLARIREENAKAPGLPIRRIELIKAPAGVGIVSTQPGRAVFDTVALDLDQLAASGVDRDRFLSAAINEEIIHNAGGRALQEEWDRYSQEYKQSIPFHEYWMGRMDAIAGEMTPAQRARVREAYGQEITDRVAAAEFVRMLVQERMRGQITEETLGRNTIQYLKQILRRLLDALRTATGTSRQNLQQHVNAIEEILRGQQQIRTVEEQQQVGLTDDDIIRLGAASINPKQNELLKSFYESANRVASRTEYGQRVETPDRKSYVATWSNGSKRWNLSIPYRTEAAPDPYDVAAREEFRRRFPRGRPNFLSAGEGVNLDSNQILIPANSLRDAGLIAQYLPVLPTDVYSAENNPLLQIREGASEDDVRTALERYADIHEAGPIKPDIVAAVDRFMDAIRSPEQTESPFERMRRESGAQPPPELTPEQQRAREINERIRGRRPETLSAASPKTQEEMDHALAVKEAEEESWVKHRALGVDDWVLARDIWTPQEIARSRRQAEETFSNAGIPYTWNEENQYYDIQPGATVESQYRLLELVKEAMRRQNWPAEPEVAALIASITANSKLGRIDYFDSFVRRQLYKLTRSEASHRGSLLGALSHFAKDIREVSLRVEEILERTWADAYGGPGVEKAAEDLAKLVAQMSKAKEVADRILAKAPELTQAGVDAGLIGQIFQMPFFTQAELEERFKAAVIKKTGVTPAEATKLWNVFREKFSPIRRELGRLALDEVKSLLRPDQRHLAKKPIWLKIQQMVDKGEFDAGHILKIIATEKGWRTPTPEEIGKLRQLARREQELRTLSAKERADVEKFAPNDPKAIERAAAEKEKITEQHRNQILREMDTRWARFTRPISLNPLKWFGLRHNTASAGLELIAANLLATIGFPFRLAISVGSQILPHVVLRPITYAWEQHQGTLGTLEGQKNFIRDSYLGLEDTIGAYLKSVKPAAYAARAAFLGRGEQRNVLRLTSSIAAFDRIRLMAKEEFEKGNVAKAYALKFLGMLDIGFRAARALDAFQTLPAETAEMYHQIRLEMGKQGKSLTDIKNNQYTIMDRLFREWMQAIADTRKGLGDAGIENPSEAQIKETAWNLIRHRQYAKANELKLPGDDWKRINRYNKSVWAWNEAETKGAGGVIGGALKRIQRGVTSRLGIPTDIGVFSNAIATAINRQLHFTPAYHFFGGGVGEGSPWFSTELERKHRAVEATAGTVFGGLAVALVLSGVIKVQLARRMDDDEKEKFISEGHKFGTVEFKYGDTFVPVSINNSPLWIIAPYLAGAGALVDLWEKRQKEQEKLNAEAAKKGVTPGKIRPMDPGDMAGIAAQAGWQTIFGSRTFSGFLGSIVSYGERLNTRKIAAGRIAPMVPGLPAVREVVSRMGGVTLDEKMASVWDFLLPLPTSQAAMVNKLGDPVRTPSDVQRVIQVLSGGNYGPVEKQEAQAYQTLYASDFKPPSISPNKGYQFPDSYRPMNDRELSTYSQLRGRYFKEGLAGVTAGDEAGVKQAYQQAERRALSEVGVIQPITTTGATTRGAITTQRLPAVRGPRRLRSTSRLRRPRAARLRRISYRTPRLAVRTSRLRRIRRLAA